MDPIIYVDLRCLQDPQYQFHTVGNYVATLLRERKVSALSNCKTIGLVDQRFSGVPDEYCALVDEISLSLNPCCSSNTIAVFIDGSPLAYDTRFSLRFHSHPAFFCAAAIHNFQSPELLGYLPKVGDQIDYAVKIARLKYFDFLFPLSEHIAEQLYDLLPVSCRRVVLTDSSPQVDPNAKSPETVVAQRFWNAIATTLDLRQNAAVIRRCENPKLAFLSPYPPDQSTAARYTAMTIEAGKTLFHSDLYTNAVRPLTVGGAYKDAGPVSVVALLRGRYNAVISVLENFEHPQILEIVQKFGGPCILHDVKVTPCLETIIERASPLIVNTVSEQALLKENYGVDAHVATSCPTIFFREEQLTKSGKQAARNRQGLDATTFLVSTSGNMKETKDIEEYILTLDLLRSWDIPAELYFIDNTESGKREVERIATLYGVAVHVSWVTSIDGVDYRDLLIASDAAIELGVHWQPLADFIGAGLSCVATSRLAKLCEAPEYVTDVPDCFSVLQVAECLAAIWEMKSSRNTNAKPRAVYLQTHNFEYYAKRLLEILEIP